MRKSNFTLLPSLIKFICIIIFFTSITFSAYGQVLTDYPCYSISEDNAAPNTLFEYDPQSDQWFRIGDTGGSKIEALATDPLSNTMYAADEGVFGTVDRITAQFTPIGSPGFENGVIGAVGEFGAVSLNDIDGLTYDLVNQIMYATHRVGGLGPGTNDLLFQIDVATGNFVPGAMLDSNGNPVDYAVVEEVFEVTSGIDVYDVDDIAVNPYTSELFAIQNQDGPSTITQINPQTGKLINLVLDVAQDDLEGLGFTYLGELYATTGDNGSTQIGANSFLYIDLFNGQVTILNSIDPTFVAVDFESFDCFTSFNDLALVNNVDANTPQVIAPGDQITFQLTVHNQGGFDNHEITLTDYIPEGLILEDINWTKSGNKATRTINAVLKQGASKTIPITFRVDENYQGTSIVNAAEISSSYNPNIDNPVAKRGEKVLMALPDIDSTPDNINNERNIVNNEINQGGPNSLANEDEDDHDIEEITISSACAANIDLGNLFVSNGVYQAGNKLSCGAQLLGTNIDFFAGKEVLLLPGFSAAKITYFSADIAGCR